MKQVDLSGLDAMPVTHNPAIKKFVLLGQDEIPNLVFLSQAVFPPGEIAQNHRHQDMTEIFYTLTGQGNMTIDDTSTALYPGVCAVAEVGEYHEIKNTGNVNLVILYFALRA